MRRINRWCYGTVAVFCVLWLVSAIYLGEWKVVPAYLLSLVLVGTIFGLHDQLGLAMRTINELLEGRDDVEPYQGPPVHEVEEDDSTGALRDEQGIIRRTHAQHRAIEGGDSTEDQQQPG